MFFSSLVHLESSIEQLLNALGCWAIFLIAVVIFDFLSLSRLLEVKTESASHADPVDNCLVSTQFTAVMRNFIRLTLNCPMF